MKELTKEMSKVSRQKRRDARAERQAKWMVRRGPSLAAVLFVLPLGFPLFGGVELLGPALLVSFGFAMLLVSLYVASKRECARLEAKRLGTEMEDQVSKDARRVLNTSSPLAWLSAGLVVSAALLVAGFGAKLILPSVELVGGWVSADQPIIRLLLHSFFHLEFDHAMIAVVLLLAPARFFEAVFGSKAFAAVAAGVIGISALAQLDPGASALVGCTPIVNAMCAGLAVYYLRFRKELPNFIAHEMTLLLVVMATVWIVPDLLEHGGLARASHGGALLLGLVFGLFRNDSRLLDAIRASRAKLPIAVSFPS